MSFPSPSMSIRLRMGAVAGAFAFAATLLPPPGIVSAQSAFRDVSGSPYAEAIDSLQGKGVLKGYPDGTFRPDARVNRAEFLKIILEARGMKNGLTPTNCFPDVHNDDWFAVYVCAAKQEEIVGGYPDGSFKPDQDIAFTEASKILSLAYKQQIAQNGNEWYEGYVLAIEGSKAIPTSIRALDAKLTRGEMAEMMWRLSEGRTDRPTKGYLNVKNPALRINTASDAIQKATSCTDLAAFAGSAQSGRDFYYEKSANGIAAPTAMPEARAADDATVQAGPAADHSDTNVQVQGVDEGDIVKTDGNNVYVLSQGVVRIVKVNPGTALRKLAEIEVAPKLEKTQSGFDESWGLTGGFQPTDLYVENGKLVVLGNEYRSGPMPMMDKRAAGMRPMIYPYYGYGRVAVKIYDVSTPEKPSLTRAVSFDGSSVTSRKIGDKFYLVLNSPMAAWSGDVRILESATEKELVPQMTDSAKGGSDTAVARCANIAVMPRVPTPQYLIVAVVPLADPKAEVKTSVTLGNAQNVYMSLENLYVASVDYSYSWMRPAMAIDDAASGGASAPVETTRLYRFAVTSSGIEFKAQGSVPGYILNQFSMDENAKGFRIATTTNPDWSREGSKSTNALYALTRDFSRLGSIEGIAPGETIYSARFLGDRAYLVTFKQVDPFFVVDTSDMKNPRILGQLKIPGYSNYLHPIDETHVLGIGRDVDESIDADKVHSDDAVYYTAIQGVKLAVFDVTNVASPKEMWKEIVGDRGSLTPVETDHKALLYEPSRNLLALPILVTKRPPGSEKSADGNPVFQGAYVYDLSVQNGFKLKGTITHYADDQDFLKSGSYWYGGPRDLQRILRVGESLVTVGDSEIRSTSLSSMKKEGAVTYDVTTNPQPPILY